MTVAPSADSITASIQGENQGQIAVGKHILQVNAEAGAIVNVAKQGGPDPTPCATPVIKLPSRGATLVGRRDVVDQAMSALNEWKHFQLYGEPEIGKTTILKHFCYLFEHDQSVFTDGVVYIRRRKTHTVDDLLQLIFDAFYQPSEPPFRPNASQFGQFMQEKRALIVVDDADLERDDIEDLLDASPKCAFLLAAHQRNLWSGADAIEIEGLPPDDAVVVFEGALQRTLEGEERDAAREFCELLGGRPLRLLREADKLRKGNQLIAIVVAAMRSPTTDDQERPTDQLPPAATPHSSAALTAAEKDIATVAAGLNGELTSAEHLLAVATLLKAPAAAAQKENALKSLQAAGQIFSGSGYCLQHELLEEIKRDDPQAVADCRLRLLDYFKNWAEEHRDDDERLLSDAEPMLAILNWAVQAEKWQPAMDLALILEQPLLLSGQWGPWKVVLEAILSAAEALGNRRRAAWAFHQLGTLHFARLERRNQKAADLLDRARTMREELGDHFTAAVSEHNWRLARPRLLRNTLLTILFLAGIAAAIATIAALMSREDPSLIDYEITLPEMQEMSGGTTRTSQITLKEPAPVTLTISIESSPPNLVKLHVRQVTIAAGQTTSSQFTYRIRQPLTEAPVRCRLRVEQTDPPLHDAPTFLAPGVATFEVKGNPRAVFRRGCRSRPRLSPSRSSPP